MGILLWMWLVLAFPVALLIDMLMTPRGNRDEHLAHDGHHLDHDDHDSSDHQLARREERHRAAMARDAQMRGDERAPMDEAAIQRMRQDERARAAMARGGHHAPV